MLDLPPPIYRLCEQRQSEIAKPIDTKRQLALGHCTELANNVVCEGYKELVPLSFACKRFDFYWNQLIPIKIEVDGLIVKSLTFNKKKLSIFKNIEFGTKATVIVTNNTNNIRVPGFAVAIFDAENRLLGVASGGPRVGGIQPGQNAVFNLTFDNVVERITKGSYFYFSVELNS